MALALMTLNCAGASHSLRIARLPVPAQAPSVVIAESLVPEDVEFKLADYDGRSFLEKTGPAQPNHRDVYITLTTNEGPMSLERRAIERAAQQCFALEDSSVDQEVTMSVDTRADGTMTEATFDNAPSLGACITGALAKVPLHQEGKRQHIVIVLVASYTSNVWRH